MASKYDPLRDHLMRQLGDRIRLSFAEIEQVLCFDLPDSARRYAPWWANTGGSHIQAQAWINAGWHTAQVDIAGERVSFERARPRPSAALASGKPDRHAGVAEESAVFVDDAIVISKVALKGGVLRMLEDYREAHGGDLASATVGLLNEIALERRRQLLDWVRSNAPKVSGDSTDLIREDRDSR